MKHKPMKRKKKEYEIWDYAPHGSFVIRIFPTKRKCYEWLLDGMRGCEGAERDHYVNMLLQLEEGRTKLIY